MALIDDFQYAYDFVSQGKFVPELIVANGDVVNQMLGVDTYDPSKVYHITNKGITEVEIED